MTPEPGELDVKTALATIDRGFSYTAPLQRRTEGISWILFGLAGLFLLSYVVFVPSATSENNWRWFLVWLAGYAFLVTGPALLAWRVASVVEARLAMDARRVALSIVVLAVGLVALDYAIWVPLGPSSDEKAVGRLILALNVVLFGGAAWAALGVAQWMRMSQAGRRDTLVLGATMASLGFALVYILRLELAAFDPAHPGFETNRTLAALCFLVAFGLIPLLAGLWRLAKG